MLETELFYCVSVCIYLYFVFNPKFHKGEKESRTPLFVSDLLPSM